MIGSVLYLYCDWRTWCTVTEISWTVSSSISSPLMILTINCQDQRFDEINPWEDWPSVSQEWGERGGEVIIISCLSPVSHTLFVMAVSVTTKWSVQQYSPRLSSVTMWEIKLTRRSFFFSAPDRKGQICKCLWWWEVLVVWWRHILRRELLIVCSDGIEIAGIVSVVCQTVSNLNDLLPHFPHIN